MNWFKQRNARKNTASRLYETAVLCSRDRIFYEQYGVADTIDGRFDLLSLYVFLMMDRLNALGPEGQKQAQALFDHMFRMIDLTLREMGIGDIGIPKHMKKMMKAFNGRAHSYHEALHAGRMDNLVRAISRNIYRIDSEEIPYGATPIAAHAAAVHDTFQTFTFATFAGDAMRMPSIEGDYKEAAIG